VRVCVRKAENVLRECDFSAGMPIHLPMLIPQCQRMRRLNTEQLHAISDMNQTCRMSLVCLAGGVLDLLLLYKYLNVSVRIVFPYHNISTPSETSKLTTTTTLESLESSTISHKYRDV